MTQTVSHSKTSVSEYYGRFFSFYEKKPITDAAVLTQPAAASRVPRPNTFVAHELRAPLFEPTPDEITAACREIQAGWTEQERFRRMRSEMEEPGVVPVSSSRKRLVKKGGAT